MASKGIIRIAAATGQRFLLPRKNVSSPAIVVELKFSDSVDSAISQIRQRNYPAKVAEYADRLLLVGISYDKEQKQHTCLIEKA